MVFVVQLQAHSTFKCLLHRHCQQMLDLMRSVLDLLFSCRMQLQEELGLHKMLQLQQSMRRQVKSLHLAQA